MTRRRPLALAALAATFATGTLGLLAGGAGAAPTCTITWDGGDQVNRNWGAPANWSGDQLPTAADRVCIGALTGTDPVIVNVSATVKGLESAHPLRVAAQLDLTDGDNASTATTVDLQSGGIGGDADLEVSGALTWTGGALSGDGRTRVASGATLAISGGDTKSLDAPRVLRNEGTGSWSGAGWVYGNNGSTFENAGSFDAAGARWYRPAAATPHWVNTGTITRANGAATTTQLDGDITGSGTIDVSAGTLSIIGGGSASGVVGGRDGGRLAFSGGSFTLADAAQGGDLRIDGGNLQVPAGATASARSLTLVSGVLSGTGRLDVTGGLTWSGGEMNDAGRTVVGPDATLTLSGDTRFLGEGRTLRNEGAGTWSGTGWVYAYASSTFENAGTLEITGAGRWYRPSTDAPRWVNTGTIDRTGTTGTTTVDAQVINDASGTIRASAGALELAGGGPATRSAGRFTAADGARLAFTAGTLGLADGARLDGAVLDGGTIDAAAAAAITSTGLEVRSGVLAGAGDVRVTGGTFAWTGGEMNGTGSTVVAPAATLAISGDTKFLRRTLRNEGVGTWSGAGWVYGYSTARLENTGTLSVSNAGRWYRPDSAPSRWVNSGTIERTTPDGSAPTPAQLTSPTTTTIDAEVVNTGTLRSVWGSLDLTGGGGTTASAGRFTATAPGRLAFTGSRTALADGAKVDGVTIAGGSVHVDAGAVATSTGLTLSSGSLAGTGALRVTDGTLTWAAGEMQDSGTTTIAAGATLAITGSDPKFLQAGRTLRNEGTAAWSGSGWVYGYEDSVFDNAGTLGITSTGRWYRPSSGAPRWRNTGTIERTGTGATTVDAAVVNLGTLRSAGGTLELTGGGGPTRSTGTYSATGGGDLIFGAGRFALGGTPRLDGVRVQGSGDVVVAPGTTAASNGLTLAGGSLGGEGQVLVDGTLRVTGGTLTGRGWTRTTAAGKLVLDGTDAVVLAAGHRLRTDGDVEWTGAGWLYSAGDVLWENAGTTTLAGGRFYWTTGADRRPRIVNTGTLRVTGGDRRLDADVINDGEVRVVRGTLSLARLTQTADGVLRFGIGGTAPGAGHGRAFADSLRLGGTLALDRDASYTPQDGDRFEVLSWFERSGTTFATTGADYPGGTLTPNDGALALAFVADAATQTLAAAAPAARRERTSGDETAPTNAPSTPAAPAVTAAAAAPAGAPAAGRASVAPKRAARRRAVRRAMRRHSRLSRARRAARRTSSSRTRRGPGGVRAKRGE